MPSPDPTLLLTRPHAASERFRALCEGRLGRAIPCLIAPVVAIEPTGAPTGSAGYAGVIFTSGQAVEIAGQGAGQAAYCVGTRTAELASAAGFAAQSADGGAADLIAMIVGQGANGPLLHLRGAETRGGVAERLTKQGIQTDERVIYRQTMAPIPPEVWRPLAPGSEVIAPVFSPFSARALWRTLPKGMFDLSVVAISDAAAQAAPKPVRAVHIVPHPNAAAMAEQVAALYRARTAC
ncbi:MAG: uroporphyrinogen-III synthase [Pseudomonadota bacterium]